jgi:hypothetical protein
VPGCSEQELQRENALTNVDYAELATNAHDSANMAYAKFIGNHHPSTSTMDVESIVQELLGLFPRLKWHRNRRWERTINMVAFGLNRERGTQNDERYILPSRDTTVSDVNLRVYELLLQLLGRECERLPDFRCTTIQVMENCPERRHEDKNNEGLSLIGTFGDFKGGEFEYTLDGSTIRKDVRLKKENDYRMTAFDGRKPHMACVTKGGKRWSVTAYTNPACVLKDHRGRLPPPADELIRMAKEHADELRRRQEVKRQVMRPLEPS